MSPPSVSPSLILQFGVYGATPVSALDGHRRAPVADVPTICSPSRLPHGLSGGVLSTAVPGARTLVSSGLPLLLNFSLASSSHFLGLFRSFLWPLPVIPLVSSGSFFLVVQILSQTYCPFSFCLSSVSIEPGALVPWSPWNSLHVTGRLSRTSRGQGPLLADTCGKVGSQCAMGCCLSSGLRKLEASCWGVEGAWELQEMEK